MKNFASLFLLSLIAALGLAINGCGSTEDSAAGPNGDDDDDGTGASAGQSQGGGGAGGGGSGVSGDLVINEIMVDPSAVSDDIGEWVELYNPTSAPVDASGWTLRDNGNNAHVITALTIAANSYAVLGRTTDSQQNGGAPVDYAYGEDFALANAGDAVVLEDADHEVVDSVAYGTEAPWPLGIPGISIELTSPTLDNTDAASWTHAVMPFGDGDLGTPGLPNGGEVVGFDIDDGVVDWHQPALKASIHFSPLDDVEDHVLAQLETAQTSIRLAFFNLRLAAVKTLLVQKVAAGVDVHVLLDKKQQDKSYNDMGEQLEAAGVPVTLIDNALATDATMHNKFAVIDSHLVMTGSANYSTTALNVSDEDLITFDDASLASRYLLEFDELVAGGDVASAPYAGSPAMKVWMGPEDGLYHKVVALLDAAQTTAVVGMFQLNIDAIVDALIAAHQRGVAVVVVLDVVQAGDANALADETLAAAGVPVILADAQGSQYAEMHSKFLVVDHQRVLTGSYNWTNLGSFFNDENIVIIEDDHMAARFEGKLASMLDAYNAPPAASLGLTTGSQAVTFTVSNVTLDPGVKLFVKGSSPFEQGVELTGNALTTNVQTGTRIDYHYEIRKGGSTLKIEGGDHSFTVPYAPGPFAVTDTFVQ